MTVWLTALVLMAALGLVGYYQGAIRVTLSFFGLFLAASLCIPLGAALKPLLPVFGVSHPVPVAFLAPAIAFLVIMAMVKGAAYVLHKKVDTYYKYKVSDTERSLWLRITERLGICMGLANATVYVVLLAAFFYVPGYAARQVIESDDEPFMWKLANRIGKDLEATKMDKAVAAFVPATEFYYDAVDLVATIFRNPLVQHRLSTYPPFLALAENEPFLSMGKDQDFQNFWLAPPTPLTFNNWLNHVRIRNLVDDPGFYTNVLGLVDHNIKDLKGYVETGHSAKYDDERILGRWDYNFRQSFARARRAKPTMSPNEALRVRFVLSALANARFTAYVDSSATLRVPSSNKVEVLKGAWKKRSSDRYDLTLTADGSKDWRVPAVVEGGRMVVTRDAFSLVFDK